MNETKTEESFVNWLAHNVSGIKDGTAVYNGERVTAESIVTRYELCYSIILFTSKKSSGFLLMGTPEQKRTLITYTLLTFLFGWWGIPWGFIWPPAIIANNLFGGVKVTVGQLLNFIENPDKSGLPEVGFAKGFGMWALGMVGAYIAMYGISHIIAFTMIATGKH